MADEGVVFHSVQARVYQQLLDGKSVILSAPTSFGKSLLIDSLIASGNYSFVVIVVPTLALIDETRRRLGRFSSSYKIITHNGQKRGDRNILILTQERVVAEEDLTPTDLFVVDEFYKLSPSMDQERSTILNHAFYKLFKTGAQFYLLGPDIRALPPELPERLECMFIRTDYQTVASEMHRLDHQKEVEETIRLCRDTGEPTLIYCRSPKRAREVAKWLVSADVSHDAAATASAVDWMGQEYHPDWLASKALARGVALHHGRMPRSVSQFMVRFFNEGIARILICTSTLIEGVNTKAKNVIVLDNKIARRKLDYFTFNNIRGRSGRMFHHFVGHVYVFHDPPQQELPFVDIPAFTQPDGAPESLLVQLDTDDLSETSRTRIQPILTQDMLDMSVIRENAAVDPTQQITLASAIRANPSGEWERLRWTGMPNWSELLFSCETMWTYFELKPRCGIYTARQLAFKISRFRSDPQIPSMIRAELDDSPDGGPDEAVENVLEFIRQWATFEFPRMLLVLDKIQKSVFESIGRQPGDYSAFASMVEGLFMASPLAALDEFGIPPQTARKLESMLRPDGDLDSLLERVKGLDADRAPLHPFEKNLVVDAQASL